MNDLKKCPFCGSENLCVTQPTIFWVAECVNCCDRHTIERKGLTRESAIEAWNARPEEDRLKAQNAELLMALERIASPKMYDCANWVKIDHIKEFARETISAARENHEE